MATATLESAPPQRAQRTDEQLARSAGQGDAAAFEALYARHHLALLSFCRHMLGRAHDAEDVVQHTFIAADRTFRSGKAPKAVRAWLYTVARNRCISVLRARREDAGMPAIDIPSTENLAAEVEQRADLRALLGDLRTLPDDQRAALLLTELGDLTHAEVAKVIGVRTGKVKALVFQAREALLASAHARAIPCQSIREEIATATGAALRRRHLRNHLAQCESCRDFAAGVGAQRAALAAILPVVPTVALRDSVFAGLAAGGGGAAAAGAGAGIGTGMLANSTAAKLLTTIAIGGAAAGGGGVAITALDSPTPAERKVERVRPAPAAPATRIVPPATVAPTAEPTTGGKQPSAADRLAAARERRAKKTPSGQGRNDDRGAPPGQTRRDGGAPPGQARKDGGEPPGQARAERNGGGNAYGHAKAPKDKAPKAKSPKVLPPKAAAPTAKPPKVKAPKAKPPQAVAPADPTPQEATTEAFEPESAASAPGQAKQDAAAPGS